MTDVERTGWRDELLSMRHRGWGFNCPAVDVDFLLCEYDKGEPAALIDYKFRDENTLQYKSDTSIHVLTNLANRASIPFYVVYYNHNWSFMLKPVNAIAKNMKVGTPSTWVTEREYVTFLYLLRGYCIEKYYGKDPKLKPLLECRLNTIEQKILNDPILCEPYCDFLTNITWENYEPTRIGYLIAHATATT